MQKIKPEEIPKAELQSVARAAYSCISAYFDDPEHQKAFETWKRKRAEGGG